MSDFNNRYASRAKEVTNAAQRNADNKEIARLKAVRNFQFSVKYF